MSPPTSLTCPFTPQSEDERGSLNLNNQDQPSIGHPPPPSRRSGGDGWWTTPQSTGFAENHKHPAYPKGAAAVDDTFRVTVRRCGPGSCEVTVSGALSSATAPDLQDTLHHATRVYGQICLVLSQLTFRDRTGVRALLTGVRLIESHKGDLRLHQLPHFLTRLLRLSYTGGTVTIEGCVRKGP
ncbi:STAS domain-containing protein [Streptomyces sp. NPDC051555]|uniref:STAS domain-containing protein n=1 Tax=Streptomyces sp. NPDC051555 TaxID=3365657 RepID=UPI0037AE0F87